MAPGWAASCPTAIAKKGRRARAGLVIRRRTDRRLWTIRSIVHQANQIPVAYHGADLLGSLMYRVGVRDVHQERHEAVAELFFQTIGVSLLAYRTEHAKSL